jgi:uncharacterized membrane protein
MSPEVHPLHPMSVHAPLACFIFTPLADAAAALTGVREFWFASALTAAGVLVFGLAAATLGALDFAKAHAIAPKTVTWHASLMASALLVEAVGVLGRITPEMQVITPAPSLSLFAGAVALLIAAAGGYLGGNLVYRHGVNVAPRRKL